MSEIKDGGPAFPMAYGYCGMSLRDWFAGQALQVLITTHSLVSGPWGGQSSVSTTFGHMTSRHTAEHAYAIADAMLAARLPFPPKAEEGT